MPWPDSGRAVAGVSAFGFGGTNAHIVLAEAPQVRVAEALDDTTSDRVEVLPLSARSPEALAELASRYEAAFADGAPLADLCYTAGARRAHHDHRLAAVGRSRDELCAALAAFREGVPHPNLSFGHRHPAQRPGAVFVFTGEGSHWCGKGRQLYAQESAFRDALTSCDRALRPYLERSAAHAASRRPRRLPSRRRRRRHCGRRFRDPSGVGGSLAVMGNPARGRSRSQHGGGGGGARGGRTEPG